MSRWTVPVLVAALASALPAQVLPARQTFRLDSGLNCVLLESHELPLIRMELVIRWERSELPAGKEGLAAFLGECMAAAGAGSNSPIAFHRALDAQGMNFAFRPRMGSYRWTLVTDSRSQETAMELLVDAVARPDLDSPLVEAQRQAWLKRSSSLSPRERGEARLRWDIQMPEAILPPGTETLEKLEFQDLLDFDQRVNRPQNATLFLYGDLNLAQAKQLALMHLGIWGPTEQAPLAPLAARPSRVAAAPEPRLLAVFDGAGSECWVGAARPAAAGGAAVEALLPILLQRSAHTIFAHREVRCQLPEGRALLIQVSGSADRDALVPGLLASLARLRQGGFTPDDLARARVQWKAENGALALHPGALLDALAGGRFDAGLAGAVEQVSLAEINRALAAWLEPGRLHFLLLGADAPMLRGAEKAGLLPSTILGAD